MELINKIGRRKTSVSRIYLKDGKGEITVNGRKFDDYFPTEVLRIIVKQPLVVSDVDGKFDIQLNLTGGGIKGQAEAARLSIARCLCEIDEEFRPALKKEGFLTRDSRMVERKKYGRAKARKKFQFSKR
jgi:small subunit ribosomal protein S9